MNQNENIEQAPDKADILKDVRTKMILRRKVLDKNQDEVSHEAGVSTALVHLFEKNSTNISLNKLSAIAGALKMKLVIDVIPEEDLKEETPLN